MKRIELIREQIKWNQDDYVIALIWTIDDLCPALAAQQILVEGLEDYASDDEDEDLSEYETITKEEANDCLEYIAHAHDASIGINWDVIAELVHWWVSNRKEEGAK